MCVCVCVCVCVSVRVCEYVCVCVHVISFLPQSAFIPQTIGTYGLRFHCDMEKTFTILIFAKNTLFRNYDVICFLECHHATTPEPQNTVTNSNVIWPNLLLFLRLQLCECESCVMGLFKI